MFDLLVQGGSIVSGTGAQRMDLGIKDQRVAALLAPGEGQGHEIVDASGLTIFPGCVDGHCHMRDPGKMEREDFWSGTQAAAAGGITTVCEMPISIPPVYTAEILQQRAETVQPRSLIDFALYGTAGFENLGHIESLAEAGAVAFKTYLHPAEPGRESEFTGIVCPDAGSQYEVMEAVARTGRRHSIHCEQNEMVNLFTRRVKESGQVTGLAHARSRPLVCEDVSVAIALTMAGDIGAKLIIAHLSSATAAWMAGEAKSAGVDVAVETCPPYLFMTEDYLDRFGPFAKNNPPLRNQENVERLWDFLHDGTIDYIATDHSPWRPESKEAGVDNIFNSYAGMPGFDLLLPLCIDAVNAGRLSLAQVARLLAETPARLFGLARKGRLMPGCDADFVLVDMDEPFTFSKDASHSKARDIMLPHDGRSLRGRIVSTWVRGVKVHERGQTTAQAGHGQFVRPEAQ